MHVAAMTSVSLLWSLAVHSVLYTVFVRYNPSNVHYLVPSVATMPAILTIDTFLLIGCYEAKVEKVKEPAGSRTKDTWLEPPVLCQCPPTEPRQPDDHQLSQSSMHCTDGTECLSCTPSSHSDRCATFLFHFPRFSPYNIQIHSFRAWSKILSALFFT